MLDYFSNFYYESNQNLKSRCKFIYLERNIVFMKELKIGFREAELEQVYKRALKSGAFDAIQKVQKKLRSS